MMPDLPRSNVRQADPGMHHVGIKLVYIHSTFTFEKENEKGFSGFLPDRHEPHQHNDKDQQCDGHIRQYGIRLAIDLVLEVG